MTTNTVRRHRPSIFWPLLLIIVGVVLLLKTLGVITGNLWTIFVNLWPLLFILGGLDNFVRGESWVWGIIALGLGTVFLLANFGYLQVSAFSLLLQLWPLLIVAIGLDLIFSGHSAWMSLVGVLIALVIVGGIGWYAYSNQMIVRGASQPIRQALNEATSANVSLSNPVGWLDLGPGAESSSLIEGDIYETRSMAFNQRYDVVDGTGSYSASEGGSAIVPFYGGYNRPLWSLKMNGDVPINLVTATGVGQQTLDLSGMDISGLNAQVAVGSLEVTLPAEDGFDGTVSVPVGNITVRVPQGALVELNLDTAITVKSLPSGFSQEGDRVYSPGADSGNARIRLRVEQPVGVVSVESVP